MIYCKITNGFGNNVFQYVAARLLAEYKGEQLRLVAPEPNYYGIEPLEQCGAKFSTDTPDRFDIVADDNNYVSLFKTDIKNKNILLSGYFENYKYYLGSRDIIKSWFPEVKKRTTNDLVVHVRTGDRLFMKNEFYSKPRADSYERAIKNFGTIGKVHIVSDLPVWRQVTTEELQHFTFHTTVPQDQKVSIQESADYINSLISLFDTYDTVFIKRGVLEDFNFIRSFDNILFEHGTLSWWAAFLSDAKMVGVHGPWRPWKGLSNKNLSKVPIDGWFGWQ